MCLVVGVRLLSSRFGPPPLSPSGRAAIPPTARPTAYTHLRIRHRHARAVPWPGWVSPSHSQSPVSGVHATNLDSDHEKKASQNSACIQPARSAFAGPAAATRPVGTRHSHSPPPYLLALRLPPVRRCTCTEPLHSWALRDKSYELQSTLLPDRPGKSGQKVGIQNGDADQRRWEKKAKVADGD